MFDDLYSYVVSLLVDDADADGTESAPYSIQLLTLTSRFTDTSLYRKNSYQTIVEEWTFKVSMRCTRGSPFPQTCDGSN